MNKIILIAHDVRSTHNVGSLLRTAECLGVDVVYLTGYSPYPKQENDDRLPHMVAKLDSQIKKTALGAEKLQSWERHDNIGALIKELRSVGFQILALEQTINSIELSKFRNSNNLAVIVGNEITGIDSNILSLVDVTVEIPMQGKKESLNVVQAAAICLYHLRFIL